MEIPTEASKHPASGISDGSSAYSGAGRGGTPERPAEPWLFEVGWEVCWQLGGIYTVLRTKAEAMVRRWGGRYTLIGPYNEATANAEFEARPAEGWMADVIAECKHSGVNVLHGEWLVNGRPRVLLVDHRAHLHRIGEYRHYLAADHGIHAPEGDSELDEVIAFGFACAELITALSRHAPAEVIAHVHEWMAGVCIPRLEHFRAHDPKRFGRTVSTVFTTHATLLGRYLANDVSDLYDALPHIDPHAAAAHYNIVTRTSLERAAAHGATVFSTVSEVTAGEAHHLIGRRPEAILPNGLDIKRFEAPHEFQFLHEQHKEQIHNFVMGHFFPAGAFDLSNTIYLFTSGRYEYRNKGMDLFIEALYRLNERLKRQRGSGQEPPTVVAFIVTKAAVKNINVETLKNQALTDDLRSYCEDLTEDIGRTLFRAAAGGRMVHRGELISEEANIKLKRAIHARTVDRHPSVVTHDLVDDANDPVLQHLRHRHLLNAPGDPVKVVFHPQFMQSTSPLLGMDYEAFVRGCHLGVFPSSYEPWGYTPMECIATGLPAVTTDLSGFGAYALSTSEPERDDGIFVLGRRRTSFDASSDTLADFLHAFTRLSRRQRIEMRNRVEAMSGRYSWDSVINAYNSTHDLALRKSRAGRVEVEAV